MSCGLVLLSGTPLRVIYYNAEAAQILTWPEDPRKVSALDRVIEGKLRPMVEAEGMSACTTNRFLSGRRQYVCRTGSLTIPGAMLSQSQSDSGRIVTALLERDDTIHVDSCPDAHFFHLTAREIETGKLLAIGLTNKEIGLRMDVSPNTVKTYLRSIMIKTGASTRSGIVGKLLEASENGAYYRAQRRGGTQEGSSGTDVSDRTKPESASPGTVRELFRIMVRDDRNIVGSGAVWRARTAGA